MDTVAVDYDDSPIRRRLLSVTVTNALDRSHSLSCEAVIDAEAIHLILPATLANRLGTLETTRRMTQATATVGRVSGDVRGPVLLNIESFRPVCTEVLVADQADRPLELPILGRVPIAQIPAKFDASGHLIQDRVLVK